MTTAIEDEETVSFVLSMLSSPEGIKAVFRAYRKAFEERGETAHSAYIDEKNPLEQIFWKSLVVERQDLRSTFLIMEAIAEHQSRLERDMRDFVEAYMTNNARKMQELADRLLKQEEESKTISQNDKKILDGLAGLNERLGRVLGESDHA